LETGRDFGRFGIEAIFPLARIRVTAQKQCLESQMS
jgi:hypothetical protein